MRKIGLFYGPAGGSVEKVARYISERIGADKVDLYKVSEVDVSILNQYSCVIMGLSTLGKHTWQSDYEQKDWDEFIPKVKGMDLSGKRVAIFGLGDHIGYANHFVDAIGDLAEAIIPTGIELVGQCSTHGYDYNESRAEVDGVFLGLPLDEDFEPEKTEERVNNWLQKLLPQFE